ncbi:hypothetical protein B4O97_09370 [Marispirochaeta aestuarii]|uniref:Uncharacterized protein n=1 Tax=Marispirochaeta aestuarii TaxID=1963862 RepID=A0A1Y1RZL6_9SPIO|nr:GntR family transcriptional regulator [Marispirochaeta aestuarii]ORC35373.1 hypothetical protein B4O97_09370 [Marispirochaeta aestuarii]
MNVVEYEDLEEGVYDSILSFLLQRKLKAGDRLNQLLLVRELSISRTPINSVLSHLEGQMIAGKAPRHGYSVRNYSREELCGICNLFELIGIDILNQVCQLSDINLGRIYRIINTQESNDDNGRSFEFLYKFFQAIVVNCANEVLENIFCSLLVIMITNGLLDSTEWEEHLSFAKDLFSALERRDAKKTIERFSSLIYKFKKSISN